MIFDKMKNIELYKGVSPNIKTAIEWVKSADLKSLKLDEKVVIDGEKVFAKLYEYDTTPAFKQPYEGHLKYIDLQLLVEGAEKMEIAFKNGDEEIDIPYEEAKERFKTFKTDSVANFLVTTNDFVIFFPQDLHKTCISPFNIEKIKKIVVKIAV